VSIEIRELVPDDRESVLALAAQAAEQGEHLPAPRQLMEPHGNLGVVARQEGKVIGAVLCGAADDGYQHMVIVGESETCGPVVRQLMDKALLKFRAQGRTRSNIRLPGGAQWPDEFWDRLKWQPQEDGRSHESPVDEPID